MEDSIFKQKYQKYKLRVKLWEKDFKRIHGRVPSKHDIREASKDIRDSYKMYYKLKTSFLEDTLNDVLSEDGFDLLESSQTGDGDMTLDDSFCESMNGGPRLPLDISEIAEMSNIETNFSNLQDFSDETAVLSNLSNQYENHIVKDFEPVEQLAINAQAWGCNVSKKYNRVLETNSSNNSQEQKIFKSNLNQKLFKSTSFSKRNPRKSLSRSTLDTSLRSGLQNALSCSGDQQREMLPDLETILAQKAKEQVTATIVNNSLLSADKTKVLLKTQLDEGWLSRTTGCNDVKTISTNNLSNRTDSSNIISKKQTFGLTNIDVSKIVQSIPASALIEQAVDLTTQQTIEVNLKNDITGNKKVIKSTRKSESSESDAVVSDSGNENEALEYRQIVKRRRVLTAIDNKNEHRQLLESKETLNTATTQSLKSQDISNHKIRTATDDEYNQDFSADDKDLDADYDEELTPKRVRKKAIARRVRNIQKADITKQVKLTTSEEKKSGKRKSTKTKETNCSEPTKLKVTSVEKNKAKRRTTRAKKTEKSEPIENPENEHPPNPDYLKYALTLENGEITSMPRINMDELNAADCLAQHYINTLHDKAVKTVKSNGPVNEKRDVARRKLEEKIASGKLNENFVTINIQKKKFVRGKKTINFSKYKKKQWKGIKRIAALSGPNMNMGGCDGGVLKCFTCGQAGHFAQNCKMKCDSLLPLTAQLEEDPSPFPTLEEAELMATQSAIAVHSRNISKLPEAANTAIYHDETDESKTFNNAANEEQITDEEPNEDAEEMFIETDEELESLNLNTDEADALLAEASPIKKYIGHKIPEEFLIKAGILTNDGVPTSTKFDAVGPLYDLNSDGTVKDVTPEVLEVLRMFGHTNFRKGQDRAIMRILSGVSTLVTLSTGSGKSLCYQLPAYMYSRQMKSITLVISPLVSLMEDQVTGVPHFLRAHCLHTNQTPQQRVKTLQLISDGEVDILLVSPEAVVAGERSTGFGSILRQLPPIAFACIDETHCVSQWSHNFRPSYLMICKVLRKNLGVKTVIGLTATATLPTRLSIINHLGIPDGEKGIISDIPLPDNLILSVSKDENRDAALIQLLNSKRFDLCQSIIIYCTRRDECERIAGFIRTCMQDRKVDESQISKNKRKRINWHAEPYHAGMPSSRRRTIQNSFMKNELRIVVATIAFGMGIDKPDIRAIIHYNMPRNFESYVQEIGRAGRDGKLSHCHLFLDARGGDQNELRRHIYANSIDRHVIRKLLQRIFVSCSCDKNLKKSNYTKGQRKVVKETAGPLTPTFVDSSDFGATTDTSTLIGRSHICPGHEIGFSIEKTVEALDIPEENIATLLCYMELDTRWNINVLSSAYIKAKVISYGGPKYLKHAAKECPPLAIAIALEIKKNTFKEDSNIIEFSVIDIAAAIGWNSGVVKYQLKNLEWVQVNGLPKRSPITVCFFDLGLRIKAPGDFTTEEIDEALDSLYNRSVKQEKTQLIQLQYVFQGLSSVAYNSYFPCASENFSHDRSDQLKAIIRDYFCNDYPKDLKLETENNDVPDEHIISDVHAMINMYPDNNFSGRNVARIFHGISSPNYPAVMWGRSKFWRAHFKTDFNRNVRLANEVIVKMRT